MAFNEKAWDVDQVFDMVKLRVTWWFKTKWTEFNNSLLDVCNQLSMAMIPKQAKQLKKIWTIPPMGILKFNVDGASKGKSGNADNGI